MPKIAIISDAWDDKDEAAGVSLTGTNGWILDNMLSQVGISRSDCLVTSVFKQVPRGGKIESFFGSKTEGLRLPQFAPGKFLLPTYKPELDRLYAEIRQADPNVIIAMGAASAWAFLYSSGIKSVRGAVALSDSSLTGVLGREYKIVPTFHPGAVGRQWTIRPIVMADLDKALRHSTSPEYTRPSRKIWIKPTLSDLHEFEQTYMLNSPLVSADIETRQDQITCFGFAPSPNEAIVIPFFSESGKSYWPTLEEELEAWNYVRRWLATYPTLFQNGLYDITFSWTKYGIPVPKAAEDTMLLHHAMQPEMEKGLGFLASVYTDEASWKFMRKGMKHD